MSFAPRVVKTATTAAAKPTKTTTTRKAAVRPDLDAGLTGLASSPWAVAMREQQAAAASPKPATPATPGGPLVTPTPPTVAPPAPAPVLPSLPAPTLPPLPTAATAGVNPSTPIPNSSGAGATQGIPPWMTLLSQMPGFGNAGGAMGGDLGSLFGGGPGQSQAPMRNPLESLLQFGAINMGNPAAFMSSMRGGMGGVGQGPMGMGGAGGGVQPGSGGRVDGGQAPALQDGMGGLQSLLQRLQGGNAARAAAAFGGSTFPFAQFLPGGANFGSFNRSPLTSFASMPMAGFGGGLGMTGQDPRANDMRRLLLESLMGGGMGGGGMGGGGGLDVN